MRTTVTFDPDVAQQLKRTMAEKKLSLKRVVNDAMRAGLPALNNRKPVKFKVEPWPFGFKPGIDLDKVNQFLDDQEVEEFMKKHRG